MTPDVVLLGVGFVQTNGERLLAEIARPWPGVKILIVANSVNDRLARTSLKWGAHDVLGKPITFEGVRGKVDALLADQTISPALLVAAAAVGGVVTEGRSHTIHAKAKTMIGTAIAMDYSTPTPVLRYRRDHRELLACWMIGTTGIAMSSSSGVA